MIPDTILRKEDCEVARTPEESIAWIDSVDEQFRADDRIEVELIKRFFEEIRPLGHLARYKYLGRPGLSLRPRVGYQNYDAEIIDTSSGNERITRVSESTLNYIPASISCHRGHRNETKLFWFDPGVELDDSWEKTHGRQTKETDAD